MVIASAAIMYSKEIDKKLTFIGLNTADFYDKQVFAIAHELYHYYTKSGSHLSRQEDKFFETLSLFNRTPDEFGYEIKVSQDDLDELSIYLLE